MNMPTTSTPAAPPERAMAFMQVCAVLLSLLLPATAHSMPNFARKYEKNCGMCHTQVPQLNKTGYEFRLAGYRLPDEIGKEDKAADFNLGDLTAARLQGTYTYKKHTDVAAAKNGSSSELEFKEATLYPLTGSWGPNFGSIVELSMAPDDVFEVENAFVRGVYGDPTGWFETRLGVMHPWEGFGASDRPISISRPLIQKERATGSPFFLWNVDEMAWEVGYYFQPIGLTATGRIGNGIVWKEDGTGVAEPAQGGALAKTSTLPAHNAKSYEVVLNQFITKDSGLSLYYYRTQIPTPNPFDAAAVPNNCTATPASGCTTDSLDRLALYANFYAVPNTLNLMAGYGLGNDKVDDVTVDPSLATVGRSTGYYGEINWFPIEHRLGTGVRYDTFDPSDKVGHDRKTQFSIFGNYLIYKGLQVLGEYKLKNTEAGASAGSNRDHQLQLLFIMTL